MFPQKGLLFYTDWGDTPHIGSMYMDGSVRKVILQVKSWSAQGVSSVYAGCCSVEVMYICVVAVFILRTNDNCNGSYKVTVHSFSFCSREVVKLF